MKTGPDLVEFVKVDGVYVRLIEYEKLHPLTPEQVERNRKGFEEEFLQ